MSIMREIESERRRQIEVEGWTPEHDDRHADGELLRAAVIYLWHGTGLAAPQREDGAPVSWPWEASWWKPKDRRRNLIRAGALCLAEKERLLRQNAGAYYGHVEHKLRIILAEIAAEDNQALRRAP